MVKHRTDRISLPLMECRDDCGECCGPVMAKDWEYQRLMSLVEKKGLTPLRQGLTCPWYQHGQCAMYEARPFVCRLFGHSDRLVCCHGLNVNLPAAEERRITDAYLGDGDVKRSRWLHEALGVGWENELASLGGK